MPVVAGGQSVPDDHSGALQLCQLRLDPGLHLLEPPPFRGTRRTSDVVSGQRIDDLLDGQAELLELAREPNPVHVAPLEGPGPVLTLDRGPESTVAGMTKLLSIQSSPEAPVACDMTAAEDTVAARIAEYRHLFDYALVHRESTGSTTTFAVRRPSRCA